jgi:hypothetical protein
MNDITIVELDDFYNKSFQLDGLLSYIDFNSEQKKAYELFLVELKNISKLYGKNKPTYDDPKRIHFNFFKENNIWHYHTGLKNEHLRKKTVMDYKMGCVNYWIPFHLNSKEEVTQAFINVNNSDGLVCDFLVHYCIFDNFIYIYCASPHEKWSELVKFI